MSIEPFRRLVKLVARAFYDEEIPAKGPNRSKSDKSDNKGIAVVVLDALTRLCTELHYTQLLFKFSA